jgi:hypothetical protein
LVQRAGLHVVIDRASRLARAALAVAGLGIVTACNAATKVLPIGQSTRLARHLYRKVKGGKLPGKEDVGTKRTALRHARRRARRVAESAGKVRPAKGVAEPELRISRKLPLTESACAGCDAISKLNIVDNVAKVTREFYERLGLDPRRSPVSRCLASTRSKLAGAVVAHDVACSSPLGRFELAWHAYQAGRTYEALQLFREVAADERLAQASTTDPRAREAFVRSAEIVGRCAELRGDVDIADEFYRRILEFDGNGIVARRLLLMLWREVRIQEAAELAPRVLQSDTNHAGHLRGSDMVKDLMHRLGHESRREASTARDENARDLRLRAQGEFEQTYRGDEAHP